MATPEEVRIAKENKIKEIVHDFSNAINGKTDIDYGTDKKITFINGEFRAFRAILLASAFEYTGHTNDSVTWLDGNGNHTTLTVSELREIGFNALYKGYQYWVQKETKISQVNAISDTDPDAITKINNIKFVK